MTFFSLLPQKRTHYKRPLIVVFDTSKQFTPHLPLYNGKPKELAGVFMESPIDSRIMMVNGEITENLHTIFHEYVHSLVAATGLRPPLYINEGLAEVYATFEVKGDTVKVGTPQPWHLYTLTQEKWLPFSTLFAANHGSKYYNESDHANIFYAQSWLLMHYIIFGQNANLITAAKLNAFINLCETSGMLTPDAFKQAFGLDYKELERALRDYIDRGSCTTVTTKIPAKPIREKITSKPADPLERDIELACLKWCATESVESDFKLRQLLEENPANARIHEILALIETKKNNPFTARDHWRKAVENNSTNPLAYVWLLRSFYANSHLPLKYIMPDNMCAEYRKLADRALELSPDCMEAYELLALVESQSAKIRVKEVNRVLKALHDMRERAMTHSALAVIYWRMKAYDSAEAVIKALSADPKATTTQKHMAHEVLREIARETGKEIPPPLPMEKPRLKIKFSPTLFGK